MISMYLDSRLVVSSLFLQWFNLFMIISLVQAALYSTASARRLVGNTFTFLPFTGRFSHATNSPVYQALFLYGFDCFMIVLTWIWLFLWDLWESWETFFLFWWSPERHFHLLWRSSPWKWSVSYQSFSKQSLSRHSTTEQAWIVRCFQLWRRLSLWNEKE